MIIILQIHVFNMKLTRYWFPPLEPRIQILWPVEYLANTTVCWSRLTIKSRYGLGVVGSPLNTTRMQPFGYMHTGVLWVHCVFFDRSIARYRMRTLNGSVRFMCGHRMGSCGFHLGIRLCIMSVRGRKGSYDARVVSTR